MSMLDILEKEINSLNVFDGNLPEIVKGVADSIPSQTIPYRMKLAFAVSEIMLYASQFRKNIKHWNDSIIPINSIMFCVAKSGASKDSSVKAARKCFESGYKQINEIRNQNAIEMAIEKARENGSDAPHLFAAYKDYLVAPNPLFIAISTTEGFIQHLNDLSNDTIGAGFIFSGEIGAELASNMNLVENIKVLAELYDEGTKEVKVLKSRENQSREVKNLPVSALFIGSQDNLLYDDVIKRKFKTEFTSKLARRSFFIFVNEEMIPTSFNTIAEMVREERKLEDKAKKARIEVEEYINDLTEQLIETSDKPITVSEEARNLFTLYKRYNEEIASTIDNQYPMAKLTRTHLQWKALKLAGAFAVMEGCEEISEEHYKGAIEFLEMINKDISEFEKELVKEPYELFADYVRLYANNGEYSISLHNLRKSGFIPMKGQSATSLKELIKLVSSYDENGVYTLSNDTVYFQELEKTESILLSYIPCNGTKQARMKKCNDGYICEEITFPDLEQMLQDDFAYTPFKFKNGVRGRDNIESGCKWIILDVDSSEITDDEAHILLSDINHFIVRTSDPNNKNKFRVLIELESEINVLDTQWKQFISIITQDLGLIADPLPKSQIFFSYKDRKILSQLEGNPLPVKAYLDELAVKSLNQEKERTITAKESKGLLADPMTTFSRAFNARQGEGSRKMIWAARRARELGADRDYILNLMEEINNYWTVPMPDERFQNTIINQIMRWVF